MSIQDLQKEIEQSNPGVFLAVKRDIGHQVGLVLEEARIKKGFTQKQLAEMIGTQQPSIARVESGAQIPSLPFLGKIAEAFETYLIPPLFAGISEYIAEKPFEMVNEEVSHTVISFTSVQNFPSVKWNNESESKLPALIVHNLQIV
jgi:transcriptional regulator with XRE-family HTH domain